MNGLAGRFSNTTQQELERLFFATMGGLLLGFFVLIIFKLPMKFTYYMIAGPVILFIGVISGRFKQFFQAMAVFIIPLNFATHFFRRPYLFGEKGLDFSPLDILLLLLYAVWLYELLVKRTGDFRFFPTISIPALCLVGMTFVSIIPAPDPYLALFEAIQVLKAFLLFLYVANHVRSRRDINSVLVLLLIGLLLQSLIAMSQKWLGISLGLHLFGEYREQTTFTLTHDYYLTVARVGGTIGHPNNLAKYIELLIPLSMVMLFIRTKLRNKLASAVVFVCAFIVLLVTLSRGGWVCFMGSIGLALLLMLRNRLINLQTLVAIVVVSFLLLAVLMGFSGMVSSRLFGDDYGAAEGRMPLNKIAMEVVKANPIMGVGAKNYWRVMHYYNPNLVTMKVNLVHNAYLLTAAETGIPSLLIILWLMAAMFIAGLKGATKGDASLALMNIGVISGMAALWAHWLVDPGYIGRVPVLWVLAGLVMASGLISGSHRPAATASRGINHRGGLS